MIQKNSVKNVIEITNGQKGKSLKVSVNKDGFCISLDTEASEPPSRSFCIKEDSDEYYPFCEFFEKCAKFNKNALLIDEKLDIERAPIMLFKKTESGILIQFAIAFGAEKEIWHQPKINPSALTGYYITLYKKLLSIKNKPIEYSNINEMAIS